MSHVEKASAFVASAAGKNGTVDIELFACTVEIDGFVMTSSRCFLNFIYGHFKRKLRVAADSKYI